MKYVGLFLADASLQTREEITKNIYRTAILSCRCASFLDHCFGGFCPNTFKSKSLAYRLFTMSDENTKVEGSLNTLYIRVRDNIKHEDNLIGQRISWLLSSQGFLFIALGLFANASDAPYYKLYIIAISIFAIVISLGCLASVVCASLSINGTHKWWHEVTKGMNTKLTPNLIGKTSILCDARYAFFGIPASTSIIWFILMIGTIFS